MVPAPSTPISPTRVPDPGVVVVLDGYAALLVLALGVTPDITYDAPGTTTTTTTTTAAVYRSAGITPLASGYPVDLAEIAAADPDVIIGVSQPSSPEEREALGMLASTVFFSYSDGWRHGLQETAMALAREDRGVRVQALIDSRTSSLEADLAAAGQAGTMVSIIAGAADGASTSGDGSNLGALLTGVGLERPSVLTAPAEPVQRLRTERGRTVVLVLRHLNLAVLPPLRGPRT